MTRTDTGNTEWKMGTYLCNRLLNSSAWLNQSL